MSIAAMQEPVSAPGITATLLPIMGIVFAALSSSGWRCPYSLSMCTMGWVLAPSWWVSWPAANSPHR